MFTDRELAAVFDGHAWIVRQGIEWREDAWTVVQDDPQVHSDLSLLYALQDRGPRLLDF